MKADHSITIDAILECLDRIMYNIEHADSAQEANHLWKVGAFICMVTSSSLWGYEEYYTDLPGLRANVDSGHGELSPEVIPGQRFPPKKCARSYRIL